MLDQEIVVSHRLDDLRFLACSLPPMKLTLHGLPHEENKRASRGACEVTPEQPFHPKPTGGPDMTTRNIAYSPIASNIASAGLTLAVLVAFAALLPLVVP